MLAGNWDVTTSNWNSNTVQLEIDPSAPDAFLQDIQDLRTGSVLTFVDSVQGTITITLDSDWDVTPELGIVPVGHPTSVLRLLHSEGWSPQGRLIRGQQQKER